MPPAVTDILATSHPFPHLKISLSWFSLPISGLALPLVAVFKQKLSPTLLRKVVFNNNLLGMQNDKPSSSLSSSIPSSSFLPHLRDSTGFMDLQVAYVSSSSYYGCYLSTFPSTSAFTPLSSGAPVYLTEDYYYATHCMAIVQVTYTPSSAAVTLYYGTSTSPSSTVVNGPSLLESN